MPGPVLLRVAPIAGESLMSLATRAAVRNVLPSSHVILEQVGAPHAQNPTAAIAPSLDRGLLAHILRVPLEEVVDRYHPSANDPGFIEFFGAAVRVDEMTFRRRRFSPASIGISPHVRALWSLMMVPCCTETWEYLVDACTCGTVQGWRQAWSLHRCDRCNTRLDRQPADVVDGPLRDGLGFLIGLLDPDRDRRDAARAMLPPALAEWDGGMAFELALALLPLSPTGYRLKRGAAIPSGDRSRYATAVAEAAGLVRRWPDSLVPALQAAVATRSRSRANVRYTGTADYIPALASDILPPTVRTAIEDALAPITAESGGTPAGQIGMMDAAALMGRPLQVLAPARRDGHLQTRICIRANRVFPTLDRAEVDHIHDFAANRISAEKVSDSLDLPAYAITQIADARRISVADHPYVIAHYVDPQLHRAEFARFKAALRAAALPMVVDPEASAAAPDGGTPLVSPIADPIALHRAARAIGGGFKPWGVIVDRLLVGTIPFTATGDRIGRIAVSARDACSLRTLPSAPPTILPPTCSQRDALEILNLPGKHAHLLKEFADADDGWEMDWDKVLTLAATRITLTELCARTGVNGVRLEKRLEEDGCPRLDRFGWWRDEVLAAI
ncbi:hypothetical protein ASE73_04935 [Sphingomonas sp. Leaf24]|jgi:hypothetical protein|uniref:TniQ family protein n=1 Tax=unclassified Sphingomonas TaxID=196159 RepID=UPI0006FA57F9|nr:hypothetical protein ASE50_04570 [Sphingomonas sp. Leaf5]KQM90870.1 hypothetical protein ASE73_04935 [Sphingomonas sp. Leaf24]KQM94137.1 hypothetical protein ASE70_12170 [Sphingomonas sp. Leaf22]